MSNGDSGGYRIIGSVLCLVVFGVGAAVKFERAQRRATGSGGQEVVESPSEREMREEYNQAVAVHNDACEHYKAGRYQEAVDGFTRALAMSPNSSESLVYRGMAYVKLEMLNEALADFNRANPSRAATIDELAVVKGDCLFVLGQAKEAEATYSEGLRDAPGNLPLLLRRAQVRSELDDVEGALADFDAIFEQDPGIFGRKLVAEAHYARGSLLVSQGDSVKGRADIDTALKMGFGRRGRAAGGRQQNDESADAQEDDELLKAGAGKE